MRKVPNFHITFCYLGISVFLLMPGALHAQDYRTGTIKSVTGSVSVLRSGSIQSAEPGAAVVERDRISTGPNSGAAFSLRDGTTISLGPNSVVDMTSFRFESTKQEGELTIGLVTGALRFISGLLSKRSSANMRIATNTATIGIRGTDFILEAE